MTPLEESKDGDKNNRPLRKGIPKGIVVVLLILAAAVVVYIGYFYIVTGGSSIAFVSNREGNLDIFVVNAIGITKNITSNPADDGQPSWSPDGKRIAFTSDRDGNYEIYAVNRDGSNLMRLTNNPGEDTEPAWSPDGTLIAFSSRRGDDVSIQIYTMKPDGQDVHQVTNNREFDYHSPSWSPDGLKLVINGLEFMVSSQICIVNAEESSWPRCITNGSLPSWSPNGSEIAYTDWRGCDHIYVSDIYGKNERLVASDGSYRQCMGDPTWSPHGKRIAFSYPRDENTDIYVQIVEGINWRLTFSSADETSPSWQP